MIYDIKLLIKEKYLHACTIIIMERYQLCCFKENKNILKTFFTKVL